MFNFVKVVTDGQGRCFYKRSSINAGEIISVHTSRCFCLVAINPGENIFILSCDQVEVNIHFYHNAYVHEDTHNLLELNFISLTCQTFHPFCIELPDAGIRWIAAIARVCFCFGTNTLQRKQFATSYKLIKHIMVFTQYFIPDTGGSDVNQPATTKAQCYVFVVFSCAKNQLMAKQHIHSPVTMRSNDPPHQRVVVMSLKKSN